MRILDANINRAVEGIRVIEDLLRFEYNNQNLSQELRSLRHFIRKLIHKEGLIKDRNALYDPGIISSMNSSIDIKKDLNSLFHSNFSRVSEALRVIEEIFKASDKYHLGKQVEEFRFKIYTLEKKVFQLTQVDFSKEIYGITHDHLYQGSPIKMAKLMLDHGIRIIQYREKIKPKGIKYAECIEIKRMMDTVPDSRFIVNDDIDIAVLVDANGVHLGQEDIPANVARKKYPGLIIGVSTHNKTQVKKAIASGANYIGVGPIFETKTKKNVEPSEGLNFLKWVHEHTQIPTVAIGGINHENINDVFKAGGKTIAMISALSNKESIQDVLKQIK